MSNMYPWLEVDYAIQDMIGAADEAIDSIRKVIPDGLTDEELKQHFSVAVDLQKKVEEIKKAIEAAITPEVKAAIDQDRQANAEDDREPSWV